MSTTHPTDEQLLLHADGEGDPAVAAHVAECPECRDAVGASIRGARAARSAPLLAYPAARREKVLAALPARERARRQGRGFLGAAVPLVALAAVVAVVGLTRETAGPERTAEQMAAEDEGRAAEDSAAPEEPSTALEAAPAQDEAARGEAVRSVAGPAEEVAAQLRAAGLEAEAADGAVEVRDADADAIEEALRGRPDGEVEVRLR